MISLLASLLVSPQPTIQSFSGDSGSPIVTACAVTLPPNLSYSMAHLMASDMERLNKNYGPDDLAASNTHYFISAGKMVVTFQTRAGDVDNNASMAAALITQPHFDDDSLPSFVGTAGPYWLEARVGSATRLSEIPTAQTAWSIWARVAQPQNVVIVSKGDLGQADYAQEFEQLRVDWPAKPAYDWRFDEPLKAAKPLLPPGVEAVQWRGRPVAIDSDEFGLLVLASEAMGQGSSSVLIRVSRFANGWSYDQETVLMPESAGYVPVTTVFRRSDLDSRPAPETIAQALNEGIDKLDDTQLLHFKKLATRALKGSPSYNPLLLSADQAYLSDTASRVAWSAIWGPSEPLPGDFVKAVTDAKLDDVKRECHLLISGDAAVLTRGDN